MPNEQYQSLFGLAPSDLRDQFLTGAPERVRCQTRRIEDDELTALVADLGGHDLSAILESLREADQVRDRPTVLFAYTVKGWGLPLAGNPRNHSALLSKDDIVRLREECELTKETEWDRFEESSPAGLVCSQRQRALARGLGSPGPRIDVPATTGVRFPKGLGSTQEAFGRTLVELSRNSSVAPYLVTAAPDVATSTNLAGFINRMGVFAPNQQPSWNTKSLLRWTEGPSGQHIELGISEMNLFMLLCQLGLAWDLSGQPLIPVGTVYDPFICRGLDSLIYGAYSGASFIVAGTPSGVSLAPEGGAHQSTITPSIGVELPKTLLLEPAYVTALDWMLCDAVSSIWKSGVQVKATGYVYYFRLTTRAIDQSPFEEARRRLGDADLRHQVLSGGYLLKDPVHCHPKLVESGAPCVYLVSSGAVLPEVLEASTDLADEGIAAYVVDITSLGRLYAKWRAEIVRGIRRAEVPNVPGSFRRCFPFKAPLVTVHDAASHAMAWLGSAMGTHCLSLGVDSFGQSGTVSDLYMAHDLTAGAIVNAALAALDLPD